MSEATDITATSDSLQLLNLNDKSVIDAELDAMGRQLVKVTQVPPDNPEAMLTDMFPTIKTQDITYIFHRTGNDLKKSIEELLNHAFIDNESANDEMTGRRGIEAFDESLYGNQSRGRKPKRARKRPLRRTSSTPGIEVDSAKSKKATMNRWDQSQEDVDFITQRTHLSAATVASIYHRSGGSLATTVSILSTLPTAGSWNPYLEGASLELLDEHSYDVKVDFPSLTESQCLALVHLTHPSTASAHELAHVMSRDNPSSAALYPHL